MIQSKLNYDYNIATIDLLTEDLIKELDKLDLEAKVDAINKIRGEIHQISPFESEPVDFVQWVKSDTVAANDYNPNAVAPPEMILLEHSVEHDGFTQPVVSWHLEDNNHEVVDGFHRTRVAKESKAIKDRLFGYIPIVSIQNKNTNRNDRIASTIRHNRARGKHVVDSMSDIVVELKRRNWSNDRISRELGMDADEILRLCQITGLQDLFTDQEFSHSWDVEGEIDETDFEGLTDNVDEYGDETDDFRTVNTSDETRIFHTYDKWECHKAGFYKNTVDGMTKDECLEKYREVLSDDDRFSRILDHIIHEWKHSCEQYLTNVAMNRIAWLGQAAVCYATGVPSAFRGGFFLLTEEQQLKANETALFYLNEWLVANGRPEVTMEEAMSGSRQSDIY